MAANADAPLRSALPPTPPVYQMPLAVAPEPGAGVWWCCDVMNPDTEHARTCTHRHTSESVDYVDQMVGWDDSRGVPVYETIYFYVCCNRDVRPVV